MPRYTLPLPVLLETEDNSSVNEVLLKLYLIKTVWFRPLGR